MKKVFTGGEAFEPMRQAEDWLAENGFSVGSMQRDAPRGILKGAHDIEKWREYSKREQEQFDGLMTGDMRNGPVTVEIFNTNETL